MCRGTRTAAERLASEDGGDGLLWIYVLRRDEDLLDEDEYAAWEAACEADADADFPWGWQTYLGASDGASITGAHSLPESDLATAQVAALAHWQAVGVTPTWAPRDDGDDSPLVYDSWHDTPGDAAPSGEWTRVLWYDVHWSRRLL